MSAKIAAQSARLAPTANASIPKTGQRRSRRCGATGAGRATSVSDVATCGSGTIRLKIALRIFPGNDAAQLRLVPPNWAKALIVQVNRFRPVKFRTRTDCRNAPVTATVPANMGSLRGGCLASTPPKLVHIVADRQRSAPVRRYETCYEVTAWPWICLGIWPFSP